MRKTPAAQPTLFAALTEPEPPPAKRAPRIRPARSVTPPPAKPAAAVTGKSPTAKAPFSRAAISKPVTVRDVSAPAQPVRVIAEKSGAAGQAWRMSGKYAVAYLRNAVLAGELLATEPRHLAKAAMAVYYDRKGKAFAWQVRFDAERWDEVVARLG